MKTHHPDPNFDYYKLEKHYLAGMLKLSSTVKLVLYQVELLHKLIHYEYDYEIDSFKTVNWVCRYKKICDTETKLFENGANCSQKDNIMKSFLARRLLANNPNTLADDFTSGLSMTTACKDCLAGQSASNTAYYEANKAALDDLSTALVLQKLLLY